MKKHLLIATLLTSSIGFSQSLTQTNEPAIGASQLMYMCDSLTPDLAATTGSAVTWDYSAILGQFGVTKTIDVLDPALTDSAANFTSSTKALRIENTITNYFNSTSTERLSQGFVYEEPNFGNVMATFETDAQKTMNYPFANGDYLSDVFFGTLTFNYLGLPQTPSCSGDSYAWIDGQGTLKLPNSVNVANVIRYKIVDTLNTTINIIGPMDIQLIRTQYEYYDATNSLPYFIHTTIKIQQVDATEPLVTQTIVLSKESPTSFVGINEATTNSFTVFPNPSNGLFTINGSFDADAQVTIFDQTGRIVMDATTVVNGTKFDLSNLNKGMYIVVLTNNGNTTTEQIVIK